MMMEEIFGRFAALRILVAGDPMVDVYHFGHVERISQEAPVPVFVEESCERRNGGAANVRDQILALGCAVENTFPPYGLWTEKHRYVVGHHQLLRVDKDVHIAADWTGTAVRHYHALVISDYQKGAFLSPELERRINLFNQAALPVIVDPKGRNWKRYDGATVLCPNQRELEDGVGAWPACATWFQIIEKRGPQGLRLFRPSQAESIDFPSRARHVYDVTGAGDTVTAVVAATVAAGGTLEQACELANLAAGFVVGEVGTAICPLAKLKELLL
jgi:rfaE bifunctional protein kinase chain/domain